MKRFVGLFMTLVLVFSIVTLASARGPGEQTDVVVAAVQASSDVANTPVLTISNFDNFEQNSNAITGYAPEIVGVVTTTSRRLSTTGFRRSILVGDCDVNNYNGSLTGFGTTRLVLRT